MSFEDNRTTKPSYSHDMTDAECIEMMALDSDCTRGNQMRALSTGSDDCPTTQDVDWSQEAQGSALSSDDSSYSHAESLVDSDQGTVPKPKLTRSGRFNGPAFALNQHHGACGDTSLRVQDAGIMERAMTMKLPPVRRPLATKLVRKKTKTGRDGTSGSREEGNTTNSKTVVSPPLSSVLSPKKTIKKVKKPKRRLNRARKWVFTDFSKDIGRCQTWIDLLGVKLDRLAFQQEVCPDSGKEHIQGVFLMKVKGRPMSELGMAGVHYELQKASDEKAVAYTQKSDTRMPNGVRFCAGYPRPVLRLTVADMLQKHLRIARRYIEPPSPSDRTVHWYFEDQGNWGKTFTTIFMIDTMGAVMLSGANKDCLFGFTEYIKKYGVTPPIVIFDVPRVNQGSVSYQALEALKNGCIFNSKYESAMVRFNAPWVIVFSNQAPDKTKLSDDRWKIRELF